MIINNNPNLKNMMNKSYALHLYHNNSKNNR